MVKANISIEVGDLCKIKQFGSGGTFVVVSNRDPGTYTLREVTPDQAKGKAFRVGRKKVQLTHRAIQVGSLD